MGPAVQGRVGLTREGELDLQRLTRLAARIVVRRARDVVDARVRQEGDIELGGLLALVVEPQARNQAGTRIVIGHGCAPSAGAEAS